MFSSFNWFPNLQCRPICNKSLCSSERGVPLSSGVLKREAESWSVGLCLFGESSSDPLSPLSSFLPLPNILQINAQDAAFRQDILESHQELFFLLTSKYRFDKFLQLSLSSCC